MEAANTNDHLADLAAWVDGRVKAGVYSDAAERELKRFSIKAKSQMRKNQEETSRYKKALSHCLSGLGIWIPRGPEKHERTVREMKKVRAKVKELLNG